MNGPDGSLEASRIEVGLSPSELWLRYFELGGMRTALEVDAYLHDALRPTSHDHNLLAAALNERFAELGGDHPVPYTEDQVEG